MQARVQARALALGAQRRRRRGRAGRRAALRAVGAAMMLVDPPGVVWRCQARLLREWGKTAARFRLQQRTAGGREGDGIDPHLS